ncbi:Glycerophosphoinositol inositolphosphodiesterase GDPD2 [Geodia barretti]|uniref:Glycerophosphoinositol inositolphosphodiesterase GDPD2 n=1 Tax=Geodia barretti TaxID=519541 RepID=A0AA35R8T1_GEOBA|nr:Glycerophosphoinositol inositolphosphodiesterase GDPD2 [Geodia barretti]
MREKAQPPRPAHRALSWTGVMLGIALVTSLAWYFFWVVMAAIELDIKHIVNWYFFARFNLTTVPRTYEGLQRVGYWMPLLVFVIFLLSCVVCPCRTHLGKVPPVIYTAVVLHNILMFIYMLVAGGKMINFFNLVLPIQIVFQVHNVWWVALLAPTILVLISYGVTMGFRSPPPRSLSDPALSLGAQPWPCRCTLKPSVLCLFLIVALHLSIPYLIQWSERVGCAPCQGKLPKKPGLIAHRGCGFVYPENTILSFVHSSQIPGMVGLETDVQVSYDGVPFLLHDPHTIRTTDVKTKCPEVDPLANATWLNYTSGKCPLEELNVGAWFINEQSEGDSKLPQEFAKELMPTLNDYLQVAKEHGMTIIFDLREPNTAHPYHDSYVNTTLKTVLSSGISLSKVKGFWHETGCGHVPKHDVLENNIYTAGTSVIKSIDAYDHLQVLAKESIIVPTV